MIANVLQEIQTEFVNNWPGEVQYNHADFVPSGDAWIALDIVPLSVKNAGYSTKLNEIHAIFVTCFSGNQTSASVLADTVSSFIQNRTISGLKIGPYSPKQQGPILNGGPNNGSYFIKISFDIEVICS